MQKQITISREVTHSGVGLHSGREVVLTMKPASAGSGIVFCRTDLPDKPLIRARASNVTSTLRATTIEENGVKLFTIEHLMAALHAHKIDNCLIELSGEEPPVTDGSASVFSYLLEEAGETEQSEARREIVIDRNFCVDDREHGRFVMIIPYDGFRVSFTSLNPHPLVGVQYFDGEVTKELFKSEIAPARTIAYEKEVEGLKKLGLGLGGTLENVIVYNDEGWLNELRFKDELVRHKVLDLIGDLRLAGIVKGHVIAAASAHELNTRLAKEIFAAYGEH